MRVDLIDLTGPSQVPEKTFAEHVLVAHVDGPAKTDIWYAGKRQSGDCLPGDVCIVPAQPPTRCGATVQDASWPPFSMHGWSNRQLPTSGSHDRRDVEAKFRARDPLLSEILTALTDEVLADNPGGPLYAETLGAALAAQLLRKHLVGPDRLSRGGFGAVTLRRLTEYIEHHLGDPIRLQDLADLAGVSRYQLVRRFKESKGQPRHQFVLRRRIERAREMLRQSDRTILEVALSCGFSSQSQLPAAFRLLTGLPPGRYRESL